MPNYPPFPAVLRLLRRKLPPAFPISVRRRPISEHWGWCEFYGDSFGIAIDKRANNDLAVLILLHEWAHALAWTHRHDTVKDHGPEWGLAYSRVYSLFIGEA